jgi:hypothetical protein
MIGDKFIRLVRFGVHENGWSMSGQAEARKWDLSSDVIRSIDLIANDVLFSE